ncbi:phospholipase D family protein [Burkholderia glumae]|uniref:phospholipase D family nuclease n=1 Tax=Burkholderia glumae TaxID=337 RepID=UPI00056B4377|nr:phospholipase D family protein [Burkholderia glumae]QKM57756.1 Phospholipase D [Burkholderia glumae]
MKALLVLGLLAAVGYFVFHNGEDLDWRSLSASLTAPVQRIARHDSSDGLIHTGAACPPSHASGDAAVQFSTSPDGQAEALVLSVIDGAHTELDVAAYELTNARIAEHLIARARAGVQVRVVLDRSQLDGRASKLSRLAAAGIPVRIDLAVPLMHDKLIVADGDTTQTGSMNYTQAGAHRNAENVLVVWHHPELATAARAAWTRLWEESQPWTPG